MLLIKRGIQNLIITRSGEGVSPMV